MKTACPKCGANVSFMPGTQKLYCEYCGCQISVSEFKKHEINTENRINQSGVSNERKDRIEKESAEKDIDNSEKKQAQEYSEYTCSTCGAKLIADKTSAITDCIYCGSRQIIKTRLNSTFQPTEMIPFKIDRNQFINMYTKFVKSKFFAPKAFKKNSRLMQTKGIYVPYDLFYYNVDAYANGEAYYIYRSTTSIKFLEKELNVFMQISEDASKNFNDNMMNSLEPFNFDELIKFNPALLNGFLTEISNEESEELERKAEARGINEVFKTINSTILWYGNGGGNYEFRKGILHTNFNKLERKTVLLPVWFINTWYKNKRYFYAVNGQTGKIVGEIPLSKLKVFCTFVAICVLLTAIPWMTIILLASLYEVTLESLIHSMLGVLYFDLILFCILLSAYYWKIKKGYTTINKVFENPVKTWNLKWKKDENKGTSMRFFATKEDCRNNVKVTVFRNGINQKQKNKNNKMGEDK